LIGDSVRHLPSPLLLLIVISRFKNGVEVQELIEVVEELQRRGFNLGYTFVPLIKLRMSRELMLDLNLLKVLGLVVEMNGRISVTEKALSLISKLNSRSTMVKGLISAVDTLIMQRKRCESLFSS